ncbi:MAG: type I-C CRISPR-associated protein Cas5 [Acidiphilium sp. 37-60-79]|nr:MAG: type I-C CRISPR-associated protein Cas5 [Acidiphilium sp. 37-60-79]
MVDPERTRIEFRTWGRYALFTDPVTRVGGEKCSYQIPTYEALKGIAKSISWKPTLIWVIDEVRVMKPIRTQTKGTKPRDIHGGNTLAIYTFLADVEYQVRAHFEWNEHRVDLAQDRNTAKHLAIAKRMLERGGRQDVFLGTRDCQGYVEPCVFGNGVGAYDGAGELAYGLTFHGFDYPDETGRDELRSRFWMPKMENGVLRFARPESCTISRLVRPMYAKDFALERNQRAVETETSGA